MVGGLGIKIFIMRVVKLAIISFIFFFLLITGISLFIPSTVRISRATGIGVTKEKVMEQLADPANWKNWFPVDAAVQPVYVGGKISGIRMDTSSAQALVFASKNDSAVTATYIGPAAKKISTGWLVLSGSGPADVTVQWWMDFKLRWYPWEKFASLLFEKRYGTQMETGLNRLKKLLENN